MSLPFLVELGTEELPPKALKSLYTSFADGIESGLKAAGLKFEKIHAFGAPRRIAVLVENLELRQPDQQIEKLGPAVASAFDKDGKPTKAAEGFARSNGVEFEQLQRAQTDKGERLAFRSTQEGRFAIDLLPEIVSASLDKLPIPKRMRWGAKRAEFVRPVHWLVMLQGKQVIDAEILGIKAGRDTRGHRFHANRNFALGNALDYQLLLENEAHVIADFNERRGKIRAQVEAAGKNLGAKYGVTSSAVIDEDLLDEVTGLVEWPVALAGNFEERFLKVPQEALISSMKEHQKYFHVVDANGKLLPHFITVSNIESADPQKVIDGNERVIRPRLSDAAFFFETDLKTPLAQRREKLKSVVFQEKLGTVLDKTDRIAKLASFIAGKIQGNVAWAQRAGELSKADLLSNMVGEFAEMQGIAGEYYARHDGEPEEVAQAIREHYLPRFAGDVLPETKTGAAIALADRFDTIVGIFGIGQPPTGSKDPFALRRAALGVLRLIVEKGFDLDLRECLAQAQANYFSEDPAGPQLAGKTDLVDTVLAYMIERFRAWYEDEKIPVEVFFAVSAKNLSRPLDINQRVHAVHRFAQLPEAEALAAANKRVSNLLAKANVAQLPQLNLALLEAGAERELGDQICVLAQRAMPLLMQRKYREGLEQLAGLRGAVDKFFDDVMVMVDDEAVRNNRLALLSMLRNLFLEVADISLLASTTNTPKVEDHVLLQWRYEPKDFFPKPVVIQNEEGSIQIANGSIEAKIKPSFYDKEHRKRDALHDALTNRFKGALVFSHKKFTLSKSTMQYMHSDGRISCTVFPDGVVTYSSIGNADVVVTDSNGQVIRDTKAEREKAKISFSDLVAKHGASDNFLRRLLQSYEAAVVDPADEFTHIYEILDALKTNFKDKASAIAAIGIDETSWDRLHKLTNDLPVKQSRHRGSKSNLRDATEQELQDARDIAKNLIQGYLMHLEQQVDQ